MNEGAMGEHLSAAGHHDEAHPTPFRRLVQMLSEDRGDLLALGVYTSLTGLLTLAIPLTAQFAVNTIAAGIFLQPLVVLTAAVLFALVFAGALRLLKLVLLERLQQRVFARVALRLAERLPHVRYAALVDEYAPQLANRFFDVVTIQKTLSKLLLDGPTAALQVLLGLTLMAFYSPYLLAFDLFLIVFIAFVVFVLGTGGLRSSIAESYRKYHVAEWLEELARCHRGFKLNGVHAFSVNRADALVLSYVKARRRHFRVLFRQAAGNYLFRAVASAGVLSIGGYLVIDRQMTLGQLVAAELVVIGVLEGLEKLIRMIETVYDLLTSVDKVGHVADLPVERAGGKPLPAGGAGAGVHCRGVRFSYRAGVEVLSDLNLKVQPGEHVSLVGESGAGKSTLASLLCGLQEPAHGVVQVNGMDVREASLESLRRVVALVSDTNEIFEGTVEENILLGRAHIPHHDVQWALDVTQLAEELTRLPDGMQTQLVSEGRNLSRGQVQRLLIARAIVGRPRLLLLDEAFTGIDEKDKLTILGELYAPERGWTIIDISHDPEVVSRSSVVHVLAGGRIAESGHILDLARRRGGLFASLFPTLGARAAAQ
jgi:ABC-type bacteriocin/lantibiotic exporter with double-glycine peptidase domain